MPCSVSGDGPRERKDLPQRSCKEPVVSVETIIQQLGVQSLDEPRDWFTCLTEVFLVSEHKGVYPGGVCTPSPGCLLFRKLTVRAKATW